MALEGIIFDHLFFSLYASTVGFVRDKASVQPHTSDDVVMHEVVKGDAFEFIGLGCML